MHIYGVEDRVKYADIKPQLDQCGWEMSRISSQSLTDEDLTEATGGRDDSMQDEMTVTRQGSGKVSLGVDLVKIPFRYRRLTAGVVNTRSLLPRRTCLARDTLDTIRNWSICRRNAGPCSTNTGRSTSTAVASMRRSPPST